MAEISKSEYDRAFATVKAYNLQEGRKALKAGVRKGKKIAKAGAKKAGELAAAGARKAGAAAKQGGKSLWKWLNE